MEQHEDWQPDEVILAVFVAGLGGFSYAGRRLVELRKEVRRRRTAEEDASWIAMHDPLTRLPNRRFLFDFLDNAKATSRGHLSHIAFSIDLDGFKKANDLLGHHGDDMVLIEISARLKRKFTSEVIARLGGDEFIVLVDSKTLLSPTAFAQEVVGILSEPMTIDGIQVELGA